MHVCLCMHGRHRGVEKNQPCDAQLINRLCLILPLPTLYLPVCEEWLCASCNELDCPDKTTNITWYLTELAHPTM
jgi:hypothetical protein